MASKKTSKRKNSERSGGDSPSQSKRHKEDASSSSEPGSPLPIVDSQDLRLILEATATQSGTLTEADARRVVEETDRRRDLIGENSGSGGGGGTTEVNVNSNIKLNALSTRQVHTIADDSQAEAQSQCLFVAPASIPRQHDRDRTRINGNKADRKMESPAPSKVVGGASSSAAPPSASTSTSTSTQRSATFVRPTTIVRSARVKQRTAKHLSEHAQAVKFVLENKHHHTMDDLRKYFSPGGIDQHHHDPFPNINYTAGVAELQESLMLVDDYFSSTDEVLNQHAEIVLLPELCLVKAREVSSKILQRLVLRAFENKSLNQLSADAWDKEYLAVNDPNGKVLFSLECASSGADSSAKKLSAGFGSLLVSHNKWEAGSGSDVGVLRLKDCALAVDAMGMKKGQVFSTVTLDPLAGKASFYLHDKVVATGMLGCALQSMTFFA